MYVRLLTSNFDPTTAFHPVSNSVMDPLSVTASAIAILQLTQSIIIGTNNFYKSARDCPAEICGLLDELTSFEMVLESLHSMIEKANGFHVSNLFTGIRKRDSFQIVEPSRSNMVFIRQQSMWSRQPDFFGTCIPWINLAASFSNSNH